MHFGYGNLSNLQTKESPIPRRMLKFCQFDQISFHYAPAYLRADNYDLARRKVLAERRELKKMEITYNRHKNMCIFFILRTQT